MRCTPPPVRAQSPLLSFNCTLALSSTRPTIRVSSSLQVRVNGGAKGPARTHRAPPTLMNRVHAEWSVTRHMRTACEVVGVCQCASMRRVVCKGGSYAAAIGWEKYAITVCAPLRSHSHALSSHKEGEAGARLPSVLSLSLDQGISLSLVRVNKRPSVWTLLPLEIPQGSQHSRNNV